MTYALTALLVAVRIKVLHHLVYPFAMTLLPLTSLLAASPEGPQIDYGAHLGGAIAGGLIGVLLLRTWPSRSQLPRFGGAARAVAAAGALLFVVGFALIASHHGEYAAAAAKSSAELVAPDDEFPEATELTSAEAEAEELAARYPRDPRALLVHAIRVADGGDTATAKALLQRALLRVGSPDRRVETAIRGTLAEILLAEGKREQAEQVVAPLCAADLEPDLLAYLRKLSVCK